MRKIYVLAGAFVLITIGSFYYVGLKNRENFFYERELTLIKTDGGLVYSERDGFDSGSKIRVIWTRSIKKPKGIATFPDGGRALEKSFRVSFQKDNKEIGGVELRPVRRDDFGNVLSARFFTVGDGKVHYEINHGYYGYPNDSILESGDAILAIQ